MDIVVTDTPRHITRVEMLDPWVCATGIVLEGGSVCVLHLSTRELLLFASRTRMGEGGPLPSGPPMACRLTDEDTWWALRSRWSQRSAMCGLRRVPRWDSGLTDRHHPVFGVGASLTEVRWDGWANARVRLAGPATSDTVVVRLDARRDASLWIGGEPVQHPRPETDAHPTGEYAWLHPAGQVPTPWAGQSLPSARYEDWPLSLRRALIAVVARQRHTIGLRDTSEALLSHPGTREPFLAIVDRLMTDRLRHRPDLRRRLASMPAAPTFQDAFGPWVASAWARWKRAQGDAMAVPPRTAAPTPHTGETA